MKGDANTPVGVLRHLPVQVLGSRGWAHRVGKRAVENKTCINPHLHPPRTHRHLRTRREKCWVAFQLVCKCASCGPPQVLLSLWPRALKPDALERGICRG